MFIAVSTGTTGAVTVTTVEVERAPAVPVTVVVPAAIPVNKPVVELIDPTLGFELTKLVLVANTLPN